MTSRAIYITEYDLERLKKLIEDEKRLNKRDRDDLKELETELSRGILVASQDIPSNIITMNSSVHLIDLDTGEEIICTLVFPSEADIDQNKISVLAPIGTGMLGYSLDDIIEWKVPAGLRRLKVTEILYQPEAAGDYHL